MPSVTSAMDVIVIGPPADAAFHTALTQAGILNGQPFTHFQTSDAFLSGTSGVKRDQIKFAFIWPSCSDKAKEHYFTVLDKLKGKCVIILVLPKIIPADRTMYAGLGVSFTVAEDSLIETILELPEHLN